MKMKKFSVLMMVLFMAVFSVNTFAGSGSKTIQLSPGDSAYMKIESAQAKSPKISAKADKGSVLIEAYDSKGSKVASGTNKITIPPNNEKANYKIVLTNKTGKLQKVVVSWIDVLNVDWG